MKKIILCLVVSCNVAFAQYFGERTTEQSFENSSLHFNSYFLNPFGIANFKNVTPGLIDNAFLNLYINPANVPDIDDNDFLFYLEFRGDRTEPFIMDRFVVPNYFINDLFYRPFFDPRWFTVTRQEPEPILSVGIINYPLKGIADGLFIGGTYQLIHKEEKFYTMPYWIYYPNYYYDALGIRAEGLSNVPIEDRYSGKDEMINEGHLFSAFTGYQISKEWSAGASINGIVHSREGGYLNSYNDEYGNPNDDWSNLDSQERMQNYDHIDLSGGINFQPAPFFKVGLKAGRLTGDAGQDFNFRSSYFSRHNTPEVSTDWYYYSSDSKTEQNWKHDGSSSYIGINFIRYIKDDKSFSGYYRYTKTDIDLNSRSAIFDTSFNSSKYEYNNGWFSYGGYSSAYDIRSSIGSKSANKHEGMINFNWALIPGSSIYLGLYFNSTKTEISSTEPVSVTRTSSYNSTSSDTLYYYNYNNYYRLVEDKVLEWEYKSDYWTFQIPVIFDFRFNENWGMMIGINRILESWEITDVTTAYFSLREKIQDTLLTRETNFGERYTQPAKKITEDFTKIFASFDVSISQVFKVRMILDPEFEHEFRIAQWWLSFDAKL